MLLIFTHCIDIYTIGIKAVVGQAAAVKHEFRSSSKHFLKLISFKNVFDEALSIVNLLNLEYTSPFLSIDLRMYRFSS